MAIYTRLQDTKNIIEYNIDKSEVSGGVPFMERGRKEAIDKFK